MNRRAFLALVGASASAGMLPTRKVSPVLVPTTIHNVRLDNAFVANKRMMDPDERQMGWMVTEEVLNDDLYGVLNG